MAELIGMSNAAWKRQPTGSVTVNQRFCGQDQCDFVLPRIHQSTWINNVPPFFTSSREGIYQNLASANYIAKNRNGNGSNHTLIFYGLTSQFFATHGVVGVLNNTTYSSMIYRTSSGIYFYYKNGANVLSTLPTLLVGDLFFSAGSYNGTSAIIIATKNKGQIHIDSSSGLSGTSSFNTLRVGSVFQSNATFVLYAAYIDRSLGVEHLAELAQNPWQLFTPATSRFYLIPSSGGVITLIVQKATHGHAVESPSLTQAHVLALADSLHGHTIESPLLSQAYALTLAAAAHAHTVEALDLTQAHSLSVAEASHSHSSDNVSLFQAHILNLSDALHGHSAEAPALTMAGSLLVADANHSHTVDAPALTQAHTLTVQDATHGHSADALTLTQAYVLAPADATHGHLVEAPTLSTELNLLVADALHSHTVEAPGLTQAHVLSLADSLHAHTVESVAMGQGFVLLVADASHGHSAESPTVSVAFVLAIQDALHSQAADQLALATHVTLVVSDTIHAHLAGTASEMTLPTGDRIFLVASEDRLFLFATEDRLFGV